MCFGQNLLPNYAEYIMKLKKTSRALHISIPVKVHLLETHAVEFLKIIGEQHGYSFYSEHVIESMRDDLMEEWGG